ncbi:hypothetical protein ACJJTC_015079 [Scirpophaga incertulas]
MLDTLPAGHPMETGLHPKRMRILPAAKSRNSETVNAWSSLAEMIVDSRMMGLMRQPHRPMRQSHPLMKQSKPLMRQPTDVDEATPSTSRTHHDETAPPMPPVPSPA